jgi:hypothetical protein
MTQPQDVDYAAATTQLSTQELALQAAQESYASIEKMSLFSYCSDCDAVHTLGRLKFLKFPAQAPIQSEQEAAMWPQTAARRTGVRRLKPNFRSYRQCH